LEVSKFDRKRLVVLEAFAQSLAENGLADTSYASVAKILKMKPAHVAYYFGTWEEMLSGAFKLAIHTAQEITIQGVLKAPDAEGRLKAVVFAPFEHFHLFPHHKAVLSAYQMECVLRPKLRDAHRKTRESGLQRLQEILRSFHTPSHGEFYELARRIQYLIVGACVEWITTASPKQWTAAAEECWVSVQHFLTAAPEIK
jgi:AcrR family transcriptional regulator